MKKCEVRICSIRINFTILVLIRNTLSFPTGAMYWNLYWSSPSELTDTQRSSLSVLTEAAIDGNYADAQNYLGKCYEHGHGVDVYEMRAREFYSMVQEGDDCDAKERLSQMGGEVNEGGGLRSD